METRLMPHPNWGVGTTIRACNREASHIWSTKRSRHFRMYDRWRFDRELNSCTLDAGAEDGYRPGRKPRPGGHPGSLPLSGRGRPARAPGLDVTGRSSVLVRLVPVGLRMGSSPSVEWPTETR